ncbi:Pyridoxine 5'-phosphate synthase [Sedimentisphaera cyanobacteriorum]|uniref:Pyridoxine 5'-phosphate synthase n=1 Tax=Sedimentisphaera cyanobacteriorum TaxID=1940790 RepID=A0A1Q2HMQ3_9BACT|nr:pyridoxine 5'-phosphate synthase [Sedimentisphaera cyanobacteriorum]AQQ08708.1 Pyridoxine 5'-phosphate synthase [Sedimentisphaera cyanobacteriorum]
MALLNVNIDHVATIRQARGTDEPDPVWAASICELAGANGITTHLREDRRHICDRDVRLLKQTVAALFNLEMSIAEDIVETALELVPDQVTIVPERRQELTTEGGLDCAGNFKNIQKQIQKITDKNIPASAFVIPERDQIKAAMDLGFEAVELHTGPYAQASFAEKSGELDRIRASVDYARGLGLTVHAGHGLTYRNVAPVSAVEGISELNIGHSIISRAVIYGLEKAVRDMTALL